jgi:hypothetical protein
LPATSAIRERISLRSGQKRPSRQSTDSGRFDGAVN